MNSKTFASSFLKTSLASLFVCAATFGLSGALHSSLSGETPRLAQAAELFRPLANILGVIVERIVS